MWDGYVSDEVDYISKLRDLKIKMLNGENFFNIDTTSLLIPNLFHFCN